MELKTIQDRMVYVECFLEGLKAYRTTPGLKAKNNPYKQGTVSFLGWHEGWYEGYNTEYLLP